MDGKDEAIEQKEGKRERGKKKLAEYLHLVGS